MRDVRRMALCLAVILQACGDDGEDLQSPVPVSSVKVQAPTTTLSVGDTVQLTATALDAAGAVLEGEAFAWTTPDTTVATVSDSGLVVAQGVGQAEISATAEDVTGNVVLTVIPADSTAPPPPPVFPSVGLRPISTALDFPLGLTAPPDDDRLFVVQKGGLIRIISSGTVLTTPFLDLTSRTATRPEQGLLGLAFAPDYATSGTFYVHLTDVNGDNAVLRFHVSADPDRADPASETPVLAARQPGVSHNGGQIAFGPDGMLYVAIGDGGSRGGADKGRAQSLADVFGSILRLDVSPSTGYTVPPDNPFVDTPGALGEIWSYGLRNPWRFSFDRTTGDLFIADVGEKRWEEVERSTVAEGGGRGLNYGWSVMEGHECFVAGCDTSGITLPLAEYDHVEGCAITGGYVYRGAANPSLTGQYFYGDFCGGWVRSIHAEGDPGTPVDWPTLAPGDNITSFGEDAAGELYILTSGGGVFEIVPK